jgi:hypothetical protein
MDCLGGKMIVVVMMMKLIDCSRDDDKVIDCSGDDDGRV